MGLQVPVIAQVDTSITAAGGTDDVLLPAILTPDADNKLIHFRCMVLIPLCFVTLSLATS